MNKWLERISIGLILVVAAALRMTGIDWDDYHHYHPDERYITWVATTIEWPSSWREGLNPATSPLNPFYWPPEAESSGIVVPQDEPRKFAYGHVPLYLGVAATRLVEQVGPLLRPFLPTDWLLTRDIFNGRSAIEFRHLTAVARALTALVDVGTVWMLYLLGRRMGGAKVGLLAAALLAVNVMHVQLAHFFISDPYLTFFVVTAVYFLVASSESGFSPPHPVTPSPRHLAAVFIGLAIGSKFSAILLFVPLGVAILGADRTRWGRRMVTAVAISLLTFAITNPFAIVDLNCEVITSATQLGPVTIPTLDWRSCYLENIFTQGSMVRGASDLPFTRQYSGTTPYLYFIEMQLRWGMGWALGLLVFAGFAWAIIRQLGRGALRYQPTVISQQLSVVLAWVVPFFLLTGGFFVKFMRYLQPITPFLILFGAVWLCRWQNRWGRRIVAGVVLGVTAVYAFSFSAIYAQEHPWAVASRWVFANVQPDTMIASEQWDDALPTTMELDGRLRRRSEYESSELTWLTRSGAADNAQKLAQNLETLAEAKYVTIMSNRVYGVVSRLPERYPLSSQYHALLFDGSLGYELVFAEGRSPQFAGVALQPDRFARLGLEPPQNLSQFTNTAHLGWADESFTVYDQPLVMIFENVAGLTAVEMQALFDMGE